MLRGAGYAQRTASAQPGRSVENDETGDRQFGAAIGLARQWAQTASVRQRRPARRRARKRRCCPVLAPSTNRQVAHYANARRREPSISAAVDPRAPPAPAELAHWAQRHAGRRLPR
ncbi:hypothetical protein M8494_18015 [Serratia ureilytica]